MLKALMEGQEDGSIRPDVNIYEVYQVFLNAYTGPEINNTFCKSITTLDSLRYTAQLLAGNIRNTSTYGY